LTVLFKAAEIAIIFGLGFLFIAGLFWTIDNALWVIGALFGLAFVLSLGSALWPYNWKLTGKIFKEKD